MLIWNNNYEYINELYHKYHDRYYISLRKNWKYFRIPRTLWVYMNNTNKELEKWYVLHHINKNKKDDRFENLQILTRWEHNKIHASDENHYMFRKWHTFWSKPKSEEHKQHIKESHLKRNKIIKENILNIAKENINNNTSLKEFLRLINKKWHHSIKRITWMTFKQLKLYILSTNNKK